jgi:hypothetical protein
VVEQYKAKGTGEERQFTGYVKKYRFSKRGEAQDKLMKHLNGYAQHEAGKGSGVVNALAQWLDAKRTPLPVAHQSRPKMPSAKPTRVRAFCRAKRGCARICHRKRAPENGDRWKRFQREDRSEARRGRGERPRRAPRLRAHDRGRDQALHRRSDVAHLLGPALQDHDERAAAACWSCVHRGPSARSPGSASRAQNAGAARRGSRPPQRIQRAAASSSP